jgi:predicted nucleic acid-binding protein
MYLVDSSVWIDYLRGDATRPVDALERLLAGEEIVGTAPIIVQEVLQGADTDERFEKWRLYFGDLMSYPPRDSLGSHIEAARLYQACRRAGKTPRSSNDCLIARIAIEHGLVLLHDDRDFDVIGTVAGSLKLFKPDQ